MKAIVQARNWVNRNSAISSLMALILMVMSLGAVAAIIFGDPPGVEPIDVYYYDLATGELFLAKSDLYPPIPAPGGDSNARPTGVRAHVFSCSDCSDEAARFIGYLEMYTPEAKKLLDNPPDYSNMDDDTMVRNLSIIEDEGHLIRSMENDLWVLQLSDEGLMVMEAANIRCGEDVLSIPCNPGQ